MYEAVADLSVAIEAVEFERVEQETPDFTRATTVVSLHGDGETGRGEDVTYETELHDALQDWKFEIPAGEYTIDEFASVLDDTDLWPADPAREAFVDYRRWAFESAALDLALRQADTTLAERLDRTLDPVRFAVSESVPEGDTSRVESLLERYPDAELKLDVTDAWSEETFERLADTGSVRVLDLKGQYTDIEQEQAADRGLYQQALETLPDAVVEDPQLTEETRDIVEADGERVSWDAPIHGMDDVRELPFEPDWLNIKPSRFGTLESLFETVAWALDNEVALYGGGQFELSVGRGQIQEVASLCYPAGPNDVAPSVYNDPEIPKNPPKSPISVPEDHAGFGF